jgi:hypothetical protein
MTVKNSIVADPLHVPLVPQPTISKLTIVLPGM